jgi:hypothetical protein
MLEQRWLMLSGVTVLYVVMGLWRSVQLAMRQTATAAAAAVSECAPACVCTACITAV